MPAKPIVAATDGSEESLRAVDWAAREAVLRGAPLRIVSAPGLLPRMIADHEEEQYDTVTDIISKSSDRALQAASERAAKAAPGLLIDADHLSGAPADAVTQSGSGALMLVVGSRGIGAFTALILGSVSRYAATHAPCPVVIVREAPEAVRRQIGIGIGDLEHAEAPLTFAFEEAALRKASLIAIHAWHTPESDVSRAGEAFATPGLHDMEEKATAKLEQVLNDWQARYPGVPVHQDIVRGHPGRALIGLSARSDLVVIGRQAVHHGPGSVINALLSHAHGPVATVPTA
jgi:nucleotide-binding universal stress UspA family protein